MCQLVHYTDEFAGVHIFFFFSSRRRNTRLQGDWSSDVCSSDLAMTAEAMSGDRERCLEAGMNDYVAKPIRVDELVTAIKRTPRRGSGNSSPVADEQFDGSIDEAVLARLADGTGGDAGFVSELIEQFVADTPALVAAARTGIDGGDAEGVRRAAHTLKSNAATFGAHELAGRSRELEDAAKPGTP